MASVSFEIALTGEKVLSLTDSAALVTLATDAPATANTVQLRVDNAAGWSRQDVVIALRRIAEAVEINPDIPVA